MSRNRTDDNGRLIRSAPPKPFYKKSWVWVVIGLSVILSIMFFTRNEEVVEEPEVMEDENEAVTEEEADPEVEEEIEVRPEEDEVTEDEEAVAETEDDSFNDLPLETQFVVINSLMDSRILSWEDEASITQAFMSFVMYYEDVQRFSYQVHSGAGTGHPEYHWSLADDSVTFEVGYVGSGAGKLIKLLPENEEQTTFQKADLYEVYLQFQNRFEIWAEDVDMQTASGSEDMSEARFEEFSGETSTDYVEVPSDEFEVLMNE